MGMPEIIVREAHSSDIDDLVRLLRELFSIEEDFAFSELIQRRGLKLMIGDQRDRGDRVIIVAENNQKVVGMCSAQLLVSTAEGGRVVLIEDMVVARSFRGKGVGRKLLLAIEKWTKENGANRLQLLADRNNIQALGFYQKRGWTTTKLICLRKKWPGKPGDVRSLPSTVAIPGRSLTTKTSK